MQRLACVKDKKYVTADHKTLGFHDGVVCVQSLITSFGRSIVSFPSGACLRLLAGCWTLSQALSQVARLFQDLRPVKTRDTLCPDDVGSLKGNP